MQPQLFTRDLTPESVLEALQGRLGAEQGIAARDLVVEITGKPSAADERRLRQVVELLRSRGHRICAHPSHGYFTARTDEELRETCEFLYSRAMTSLRQVAALNRVALPDLRGQLHLDLNPQEQR